MNNNVIITNSEYLFSFKTGHEIIQKLENQLRSINHVNVDWIRIEYKQACFALFELKSFKKVGQKITFYFEFNSFES
jgi:primosomal protein N''